MEPKQAPTKQGERPFPRLPWNQDLELNAAPYQKVENMPKKAFTRGSPYKECLSPIPNTKLKLGFSIATPSSPSKDYR